MIDRSRARNRKVKKFLRVIGSLQKVNQESLKHFQLSFQTQNHHFLGI